MEKNRECAICAICCQPMKSKNGCTVSHLIINGKRHNRIKAGDELDLHPGSICGNVVCHDCNAGAGQYHHLGCDSERCPVCHGQLFICDCDKQPAVPLSPMFEKKNR